MSPPGDLRASILINNYNYGRYLGYAIDSALEQSWPGVQVLVVDDGSTDESRLLLETYGDSIQALLKENGGQASSVNAALPLVEGDAVILLDADDMLDPTAVERSIGYFADPGVVKVSWPMAIVDGAGYPTGEIRFQKVPIGNFRKRALKIGPASHYTPSGSANFWRTSFLRAVSPVPEEDFRNVVDAYLFTFSPFFGTFQGCHEPLTFYRVHGRNFTAKYAAGARLEDWERRAIHLHAWLVAQGEDVSIARWRRNNPYYQRLHGIAMAEAAIGRHLPADAGIVLLAGPLYHRSDIRPLRPVYRAPDELLAPETTEADFRTYLDLVESMDVPYIALEGPGAWQRTNLAVFDRLLRSEHEIVYEDRWIVLARVARAGGDEPA